MISILTKSKDDTKLLIGAGFLLVFSLMILATWLSMSTLQGVNIEMSNVIADTERKTTRAHHMRNVIRMRSKEVRELVQTRDSEERRRIFNTLIEHTNTYQATRRALSALSVNSREQTILDRINRADQRVSRAYERAHASIFSPEQDLSAQKTILNEVQLHELVLLNHLNELVRLERTLAKEALENNASTYRRTQRFMIYLLGAAFALSMIISMTVIARVARANRRIAHLANHDDLTGLHNRRSFEQHLQYTIDNAERSDDAYGLLYIDLDRFKIVNDTCGHHAGDQLLIELTQRMSARLRRGDLFARVGGDEFAIIAQGHCFEDITCLAEDLRVIVSEFTFQYEDQSFKVSLSVGVTPINGEVRSLEQVLADVDSACYVAKQSGRNRVHVTQDDDTEMVKYRSNLAGIQAIRKALTDNRLVLFYQPIFEIKQRRVQMTHCEILLRIRSEKGELYSPARFIPIAEKYNVMTEVDCWVFTQVIDWLAEHQSRFQIPRLLVNLSGLSFADGDFSKFIVERLSRGDVDPKQIAFEVSESVTLHNFEKVSRFIDRIRALGCELALDDFGAGFSSFAYLKKLSFDYLKIDGSLVKNIAKDDMDRDMVAAINHIGHTVGARTIAEFVEDDDALNRLREMNVDFAQGYGLRRPTPLSRMHEELATSADSRVLESRSDIQSPVSVDARHILTSSDQAADEDSSRRFTLDADTHDSEPATSDTTGHAEGGNDNTSDSGEINDTTGGENEPQALPIPLRRAS